MVHEAPSHELAGIVIDALLAERLGDALRDAAVQLPFGQEWVQHRAHVVDADEPAERDLARLTEHLDDRDVDAERDREVRRFAVTVARDAMEKAVYRVRIRY